MNWSEVLMNYVQISASFAWSTLNRVTQWVIASDTLAPYSQQVGISSSSHVSVSQRSKLSRNQRRRRMGCNTCGLLGVVVVSVVATALSQPDGKRQAYADDNPSPRDPAAWLEDRWKKEHSLCEILSGSGDDASLACVSEAMSVDNVTSTRPWRGFYYDLKTLARKGALLLAPPPISPYYFDPLRHPLHHNQLLKVTNGWVIVQQINAVQPIIISAFSDVGKLEKEETINRNSTKILSAVPQGSGITIFIAQGPFERFDIVAQHFTAGLQREFSQTLLQRQWGGLNKPIILFASLPDNKGFAMLVIACMESPSSLNLYDQFGKPRAVFQREDLCFLTHPETVVAFAVSRAEQIAMVASDGEENRWLLLLSSNFSRSGFDMRQVYSPQIPRLFPASSIGFFVPVCLSQKDFFCGLYALGLDENKVFSTVLANQPPNLSSVGTANVRASTKGLGLAFFNQEDNTSHWVRIDSQIREELSPVVLFSGAASDMFALSSKPTLVLLGVIGGLVIGLACQKLCQTRRQQNCCFFSLSQRRPTEARRLQDSHDDSNIPFTNEI